MQSNRLATVLLLVLILVFLAGLAGLIQLRFERGDMLPEYSSLRADPLGAKALYESLDRLSGVSARRNYRRPDRLEVGGDAAVLFLGIRPSPHLPPAFSEALNGLAVHGGRIVLALRPGRIGDQAEGGKPEEEDEGAFEKAERPAEGPGVSGFRVGMEAAPETAAECVLPAGARGALPARLPWHSDLYLEGLGPDWKTIYARAGRPVAAQRSWGAGSILVVTDGYHFSNEALLKDRRPGFLAWCIGRPVVIFDEYHLGASATPGPADLLRKYRLHGLLAGLLLLAGLYIWKNAAALVRPEDEEAAARREARADRDNTAGLIRLLIRSVPGRKLAETCLVEWRRTSPEAARLNDETVRRLSRAASGPDPAAGYNEIYRILSEGR